MMAAINPHCGQDSFGFRDANRLVCASKVYSGLGADIVYGIISLKLRFVAQSV